MSHQLVVPALGESVSEATVARWLKNVGDVVKIDDPLVELETDKVTLEVNAPQAGTLEQIAAPQGTIVQVGQTLGTIGAEQAQGQAQTSNQGQESTQNQAYTQKPNQDSVSMSNASSQPSAAPGSFSFGSSTQQTSPPMSNNAPTYTPYTSYGPQQQANSRPNNTYYQPSAMPQNVSALREALSTEAYTAASSDNSQASPILSPAARKIAAENNMSPQDIQGSGRDGRVTKQDVQQHQQSTMAPASIPFQPQSGNQAQQSQDQTSPPTPGATSSMSQVMPMPSRQLQSTQVAQPEERVRMTRLRQRIAERLKEAQNTAAMLTTFNEIDMSHVMATRESYREKFEKRFGIKLGFMSFFVKAAVSALKEIPSVNAEIQDDYIIYKNHYDIGVAVSAPQGLVVPVVRDADHLNFAEIENAIGQLSKKARTGKLSINDLSGGTFTITNGGVFGSLMSTPILNPPQSGILGMHKIQKRPIVVDDRVEIRPMMYVALTYDHRIIDGREAVTFLVRIKENIEDPQRILLGI